MTKNQKLCPACGSGNTKLFHVQDGVPVHSVLTMPDRESAISYTKGRIALRFCEACGFIYNAAYDGSIQEYSERCEETQGFSRTFGSFARKAAEELVRRYDLHGKSIIEIGCGKGEFLSLLCTTGGNTGIGFDPAYVDGRLPSEAFENITFVRDFFGEPYADLGADFICCRMTLEHIGEISPFIAAVRKAAGRNPSTVVHFQVPDAKRILASCAFEDIYYEHCSYFSPGQTARLFRRNGFEILDQRNEYHGQYLVLEARPLERGGEEEIGAILEEENELAQLSMLVSRFPERVAMKTGFWKQYLEEEHSAGRSTVLWGSGSKAVSFLTTLRLTEEIGQVVDINPHRQGTYMAGTGHPIIAPEDLRSVKPDTVIVMNEVYVPEIKEILAGIGFFPEILTLEMAEAASGKL